MNDLISRQDALKALDEMSYKSPHESATSVVRKKHFGEILEKFIMQQPSAQQWIPCSERMPEEYVSVLCYQPIYEGNNIWIGYLNADGFWVDSDGWEKLTNSATAWMPLPEPFKDKHED